MKQRTTYYGRFEGGKFYVACHERDKKGGKKTVSPDPAQPHILDCVVGQKHVELDFSEFKGAQPKGEGIEICVTGLGDYKNEKHAGDFWSPPESILVNFWHKVE